MLYSYVPSLVKCYVFGVELKGLSKDSIVSIERLDSFNTFRKAQDGTNVAFVDSNPTYRVTIHIEQVSESNEFLHTVLKLHQRAGLNLRIPIRVSETSSFGGTQFNAFDCFFETEPSSEFGSVSVARQWSFICHNASYSLRGTADSGFITESLRATLRMIELSRAAGIDLSNIEQMIKVSVEEAQRRLKDLFK